MLIEQAFFNLPEILVGSRYPTQGYEGGIVAAFGMAVLQELNGRNANNPISHLIAERIYQIDRIKSSGSKRFLYEVEPFMNDGKPRYLRADLHVDLASLRTGSHALSRYGWRLSNWIEAKFFRDSFDSSSSLKSQATGALAADLIRLMSLPPIEKPLPPKRWPPVRSRQPEPDPSTVLRHEDLFTGRYLLHVYQGRPENYHALHRNRSGNRAATDRKWLRALLTPGTTKIESLDLKNETPTLIGSLNPELRRIDCQCTITNFVLSPSFEMDREDSYTCILSRIDSYTITLDDEKWNVTLNRAGIQSRPGAFNQIRYHVGNFVHAKEKIESDPPKKEDHNAEVENDAVEPAPSSPRQNG